METKNKSSMDEKKIPPKTSSRSAGLVLFRLLLTVIIAVILGTVIYYSAVGGIPFLNSNIFQPIEENESQVNELRETQKALEDQISDISATLDAAELSGYQATIGAIDRDLQGLAEKMISAQETVDTNSQMNTYMSTVYPQMLFDLEAKQDATSRNLSALATAQMGSSNVEGDLALIRILEQLSRANQFLLHSNFGLAEDTLKYAKDDLLKLQQSSYAFHKEYLAPILDLVEGAISDLPSKPSLAEEKIGLAWKLGITGLPQLFITDLSITLTPTPYSPEFTPSPTTP